MIAALNLRSCFTWGLFFTWGIKVILSHFYFIAFVCLAASLNNNALWVSSSYVATVDKHPKQPTIYAFKLSLYCTEHWATTLERRENGSGVNTEASFYCEDPMVIEFLADAHQPILSAGFSMAFMILAFFALFTATFFSIWKVFRKNHFAILLWVMFLLFILLSIITSGVAARMVKDLKMDFEKTLSGQFEHSDSGHSSYFSNFPSIIEKNSDGTQNFEITTGSAHHCLVVHMFFASLVLLLGFCVVIVDGSLQWAAARKEKREKKESEEAVPLSSASRMGGPSQITSLSSTTQRPFIGPTPTDGETMKLSVKEFNNSSSKRVHIGSGSKRDSVRSNLRDISTSNSVMPGKGEAGRSG
ncbi:unnamed protein product, partial [Mesorhabditis belari]|uniref:Uncharacterized protein n=1 Tax=Mesorhabditis belari TaxID=2138241 RepID=A0AAF3ESM1_9BILA